MTSHHREPLVKAIDLATLLKDIPKGAWVAISSDHKRVVAYGFELREVVQQAKKQGEDKPILARVPESAVAVML